MKKEKRFITLSEESTLMDGARTVLVDTQTGVEYLFAKSGYSGGLCALLDADGKPLVCPRSQWEPLL